MQWNIFQLLSDHTSDNSYNLLQDCPGFYFRMDYVRAEQTLYFRKPLSKMFDLTTWKDKNDKGWTVMDNKLKENQHVEVKLRVK